MYNSDLKGSIPEFELGKEVLAEKLKNIHICDLKITKIHEQREGRWQIGAPEGAQSQEKNKNR